MTRGVTMKLIIGIPPCVTQEKLNSKKPQIETRLTVKSEVPGGDPKCPNHIEASVYDIKPVHYTSMVSEELKWVVKDKERFNVETVQV